MKSKIVVVVIILTIYFSCVCVFAKFSYERGFCDISISSVVKDMFRNEMLALANPEMRSSNNKILKYDLYTPKNPTKRQTLKSGDTKRLKQSYFNPKWPVRISIHGWTGKSSSCSNAAIKDAYLSRGNFNVIIVDWSAHSMDISYGRISRQLKAIAANLFKFLVFLHSSTGVPYESMYLIGHSAGSHIAGFAGRMLKPQRFGVIYALDPAGLNQLGASESNRLTPNDAIYVESIHTDVTLLGNPTTQCSHASFFINWGQGQPHCPNATATEFQFTCDHFSALYYFAESIREPKRFGALQCQSKNQNENNNDYLYKETLVATAAATATATATRRAAKQLPSQHAAQTSSRQTTATDIANYKCHCANGNDICKAITYMGGEPAVPKAGVFYLSTKTRAPYGYGSTVQMRLPREPKFLENTLLKSPNLSSFPILWKHPLSDYLTFE